MPKRRILVADDDPDIRRTLQIGLEKAGYEVIEARDGEEATRLWRENGVDLIIADIYMPNKSGLQLIMELRAHNSTIPVIAMSDGGRNLNLNPMIYSEVLGSVRTIPKPFSLEGMVAMVKEALAKAAD
jgi:two-component system chemotaxis response regulator CheY